MSALSWGEWYVNTEEGEILQMSLLSPLYQNLRLGTFLV